MASQLYDYTPTELQKLLDESSSYKELLRKIGMCDHGNNYSTLRKVIDEYGLDLTTITENRKKINYNHIKNLNNKHSTSLEEILVKNSTYTNGNRIKEKLFEAGLKERKCERCCLTEWQGHPIPLQLHHKNGIHNDNTLDNLEILCPNCHALTDTFAGKNLKKAPKIILSKREHIKKGISADGQKLYDGYGNYKILCPECQKNFKNVESNICRECYDKKRKQPKVSKEELYEILKTNTYTSAALMLGVDRETVSKWYKYYLNEEQNNNKDGSGGMRMP